MYLFPSMDFSYKIKIAAAPPGGSSQPDQFGHPARQARRFDSPSHHQIQYLRILIKSRGKNISCIAKRRQEKGL